MPPFVAISFLFHSIGYIELLCQNQQVVSEEVRARDNPFFHLCFTVDRRKRVTNDRYDLLTVNSNL
jgi:hypothetical protein